MIVGSVYRPFILGLTKRFCIFFLSSVTVDELISKEFKNG